MSSTASSAEWTDEEVENYLSHLSEAAFKNRTPQVVYLSAILIVGVVGNALVLLVYGLRFRPSAPRTFVLVMAVLDLIINVVVLPLQIATVRHAYDDNTWRCRVFFGFSTISTPASGVVLVLVAFDQFRRVCAPLKKQLNSRQAFYLSLTSVFLMTIIFAPFVPCSGVHRVNTTEPGVQARMCWLADEYKDTLYLTAYKITAVVVLIILLAILVVSYTGIGIKLWRRRAKKTQSLRLQQVRENQNDPGRSASETANSTGQDNSTGQQDQNACVEKGLVATRSAAGHEGKFETAFCDSSSTENRSSNSAPVSSETTPKGPAQLDTEITTHGNESKCDLPKHDQCQTESRGSSREGGRSNGPPDEKRDTTIGQKKAPAGSTSAHQYLRRRRSRTTLMMAVLTLLFVINWLPHLIMRALQKGPFNLCHNFTHCGYNTYAILQRSIYLNSAVNAFVYSCNERFRHECRQFVRGVVRKLVLQNADDS